MLCVRWLKPHCTTSRACAYSFGPPASPGSPPPGSGGGTARQADNGRGVAGREAAAGHRGPVWPGGLPGGALSPIKPLRT